MDYLCAADYLQLPKFSLENWYIFRENNPIFTKIVLCMVLWIEKSHPKESDKSNFTQNWWYWPFRFHFSWLFSHFFFVFCVRQCSQKQGRVKMVRAEWKCVRRTCAAVDPPLGVAWSPQHFLSTATSTTWRLGTRMTMVMRRRRKRRPCSYIFRGDQLTMKTIWGRWGVKISVI